MLHRVKKPNDMHAGKWNGLGGKLEPGESPEMCAAREVLEESGLTVGNLEWHGILTFPAFAKDEDWLAFVYVAREPSGTLIDSPEGDLAWIPDDDLATLTLWQGDRIFIPWLLRDAFFSGRFSYVEGVLHEWSATFYSASGRVVGSESSVVAAPLLNSEAHRYEPADDSYCWICGGAVAKRHCKITCVECGFMRDCSDP